jgi:hypothetical protein
VFIEQMFYEGTVFIFPNVGNVAGTFRVHSVEDPYEVDFGGVDDANRNADGD